MTLSMEYAASSSPGHTQTHIKESLFSPVFVFLAVVV